MRRMAMCEQRRPFICAGTSLAAAAVRIQSVRGAEVSPSQILVVEKRIAHLNEPPFTLIAVLKSCDFI